MRILAHLSDVHFGREDPVLVQGLLRSVAAAAPDVIVVSGDLTQRARKRQFRAAAAFLKELPPVPRIVVPGNHDISATNLLDRVARPLERYKRFITPDLEPFHSDSQVAIAGINTVRLFSRKDGRINRAQVQHACRQFGTAAPGALRVIVTHHPLDLPAEDRKHALAGRSRMAMRLFSQCGVDLFLSGHLHTGQTIATSARYQLPGWSAVVAHAGTAVSTRTRAEKNAWNLIRLGGQDPAEEPDGQPWMEIRQMVWSGRRFEPDKLERYAKASSGWVL